MSGRPIGLVSDEGSRWQKCKRIMRQSRKQRENILSQAYSTRLTFWAYTPRDRKNSHQIYLLDIINGSDLYPFPIAPHWGQSFNTWPFGRQQMNIQTAAACIVLTGPNGFMGVWRFPLLLDFVDSGNNFFFSQRDKISSPEFCWDPKCRSWNTEQLLRTTKT